MSDATDRFDESVSDDVKSEIKLLKAIKLERELTDKLYAIKLVEVIVFGMVGFILIAVLGAIVALVVAS